MKIGFVGLGSMGAPIARRLARSGHDVTGCDISPQTLSTFDEPGARREADPFKLAKSIDVLGVCVRTDDQLRDLLGDGRLFDALGQGKLCILNSTVSPTLARELAVLAETRGIDFVDVGVSGGAALALDGKLSLFVGGTDAAVERARPFLHAIGVVAHLGPAGRGQEGKLINNLLSIANMAMSALAIEMGGQLQFDREQLRQALLVGSARSFALDILPSVFDWQRMREDSYWPYLHELLGKDVRHGGDLVPPDAPLAAPLVAAAQAVLDCIDRVAATRRA